MRFLDRSGFALLLRDLAGEYDLYGPVRVEDTLVLSRIEFDRQAPEVAWNDVRLPEPLKSLWFQPSKVVARWVEGAPQEPQRPRPRAIVGAKACDLEAIAILDRVFRDHDFKEPAWCDAREHNLVIAGDCTDALDSCFCTMLGGQPHANALYDLNLSPVKEGDGYLVEIGSEKGQAILDSFPERFQEATPRQVAERDWNRGELEAKVGKINERFPVRDPFETSVEKNLKTRIWGELASTCVNCNACNMVCPTCHCFLLKDVASETECVRVSLWDSCFSQGYARMAGGGTPRLQLTERFKNHYFHKFVGFPRNWGGGPACTGCGRCIDACMGRIDKRDCLHQLETRWIPSETVGEVI